MVLRAALAWPPGEAGGRRDHAAIGPQDLTASDESLLQVVQVGKGPVGDGLIDQHPDPLDQLQLG